MTAVEQWGIPGRMRSNRSQEVPRAGLRALPGGLNTGLPEAPHGSEFTREASMIDIPASVTDGPVSVIDVPATATFRMCCHGIVLCIRTESVWVLQLL